MHLTALDNCKCFFDTYVVGADFPPDLRVIEIGAQDVNGSLRQVAPRNCEYVGVDFVQGKGVDVVLQDPYSLPFADESVDVVLSSSCLEHSEMFWIVFLEVMRILKPKGLFYLNVPSNGPFHRYPVDCWRFYPDSGRALVSWARRNSINAALLESYTSAQADNVWNDFVAIFLKDEIFSSSFPRRIIASKKGVSNGVVHGKEDLVQFVELPEDQRRLQLISRVTSGGLRV